MLERYNAVQTVAFCGVFPEIRRAWASVDNALFLWRLDRWCAGALRALRGNTCMTNKHSGRMAMQHQPCRRLIWLRMRTHTSRLMRYCILDLLEPATCKRPMSCKASACNVPSRVIALTTPPL